MILISAGNPPALDCRIIFVDVFDEHLEMRLLLINATLFFLTAAFGRLGWLCLSEMLEVPFEVIKITIHEKVSNARFPGLDRA